MFFNEIRLPDEIGIALEEQRLVIFAGAGVSVPPPSNLPLFNGLASRINGGKQVDAGREDRVLGQLDRAGKNVREAAAQILCHPETRPTLLHREILRLFGSPEKVRVVTTNFDEHFPVAARKLFKKTVLPEYYAPALPLGDDFTGLVYLHGSARHNHKRLVLTDQDFGAAYLTRGWARDFLVPLFSKYSVMFIGYSHSDVTLTYLARGLNPSQRQPCWSMGASDISQKEREHWEHLDISAIEYRIDPANPSNPHHNLTSFFSEWADHENASILKKGKRVKALARGLPPESPAASDYLTYCLGHARLAKEFCDAIRHPAWVGWMHDHGFFAPFFDDVAQHATWNDGHGVLAHWLCSFVRRQYPVMLLDLIRTHQQRLSSVFSRYLAHAAWSEQTENPDPRFADWVSILVVQERHSIRDYWALLLNRCQLPEHLGIVFRLFENLTTPEIRIERSWNPSVMADGTEARSTPKRVEYAIRWPREAKHGLAEAWTKIIRPHLAEVADELALFSAKQLTQAYLLLAGVRKPTESYDRLSSGRSSIAEHEQDEDRRDECLSCLIDILRDCLAHWVLTDPVRAKTQIHSWSSSRFLLFRRLAVYATAIDPQYSSDERIDWLLTNDLIFQMGVKKEVFDVLVSAYPAASTKVRLRLIRRINRGYREKGSGHGRQTLVDYEKFNVLVWLRRIDTNCKLVSQAIEAIHVAHPKFAERDHPEFESWHGPVQFHDPAEGMDSDLILAEPPEQLLDQILRAIGGASQLEFWNWHHNLPLLFEKDKNWAFKFVEAASRRVPKNGELWGAVFYALKKLIRTKEDWHDLLDVIEKLPHESEIYSGIAYLISNVLWDETLNVNDATVERAATLMERAWQLCKHETALPDDSYGNWLTSAINHVGGWIGEFWVHYCSHLRHRSGANWPGIPASLRLPVEEAIVGKNRVKVHARIAMTPWIDYFFAWDKQFTVDHFVPLLDWKRDPIVAQQSWSVLLNYKRGTTWEFEEQLIPMYRQFAEQMQTFLKDATEKSEQFGEHAWNSLGHCLATLAMQVIPNPVEGDFFRDFLPLLPPSIRRALAQGMDNHLTRMDDGERQQIWNTWLKSYLDLRLVGIPVALSPDETEPMLHWCLHLGSAFPEAVERIARMPLRSVFSYSIFDQLLTHPALDAHPVHACLLVIAALRAEGHPHMHSQLLSLRDKLRLRISGSPELLAFEEILYLRGWPRQ